MSRGVDITIPATGAACAVILAFVGYLIYSAGQPYMPPINPWDGCELVRIVKTEDREYCGKACSMPVFADTYECPAGQKTFLDARWSAKP